MASHLESGAAAEGQAADYLVKRGLSVVARNLRCRAGEIDIVCIDREVLVIVEVRRRASRAFGGPLASVTARKRQRIIRASRFHWQRQPDWRARLLRFDVLGVEPGSDGRPVITWIKDAFRAT